MSIGNASGSRPCSARTHEPGSPLVSVWARRAEDEAVAGAGRSFQRRFGASAEVERNVASDRSR